MAIKVHAPTPRENEQAATERGSRGSRARMLAVSGVLMLLASAFVSFTNTPNVAAQSCTTYLGSGTFSIGPGDIAGTTASANWNDTFAAGPVYYYVHSSFTPAEVAAVDSAVAKWNAAATNVNFQLGGTTASLPDGTATSNIIGPDTAAPVGSYAGIGGFSLGYTGSSSSFTFDVRINMAASASDFHAVVLHELGHALGLDHIVSPAGQVMGSSYVAGSAPTTLGSQDLVCVQNLYDVVAPPTATAVPTSTATPTATTTPTLVPTSTPTATATPTSTSTPTVTPVAATATPTSTPTTAPPPTSTPTATAVVVPPTSTPTATAVVVPPTATAVVAPPTSTPTATAVAVPPTSTPTATATVAVPTSTPTATAVASLPTSTPTATAVAVPPATATATVDVSTPTPTATAVPSLPTSTPTAPAVVVDPTATPTEVVPDPTATATAVEPTATPTEIVADATPTPTTAAAATPTATPASSSGGQGIRVVAAPTPTPTSDVLAPVTTTIDTIGPLNVTSDGGQPGESGFGDAPESLAFADDTSLAFTGLESGSLTAAGIALAVVGLGFLSAASMVRRNEDES